MNKKVKALALLSGIDSMLAAKLILDQGIEVHGICFYSPFFAKSVENAKKIAEQLKIPLRIVDISKEFFEVLKNPKYGYGSQLNPCIDCKILMLKKAKEILEKEGYDFIITGEVLNERPFTQNRRAMKIIEKESGTEGILLRPLSAKLLEETKVEKEKIVDREKLLDIKGRRRTRQLELAKNLGLWYPQPAGGCLLTDPIFAEKMRQLMKIKKDFDENDVELLKVGRHFYFNGCKIVVGRNKEENEKIKSLAKKNDVIIEIENYPAPTTLIREYEGKIDEKVIEHAKNLTKNYSKKAKDKEDVKFKVLHV